MYTRVDALFMLERHFQRPWHQCYGSGSDHTGVSVQQADTRLTLRDVQPRSRLTMQQRCCLSAHKALMISLYAHCTKICAAQMPSCAQKDLCCLQVVGKVTPDAPRDAFVQDMVSLISTMNEVEVHQENITVQVGGVFL